MKREMLYQFGRLERKGIPVPKKISMASSLDDMRAEYERLKRDREVDVSVQFQRRAMLTLVSGIELLNRRLDPFDIKLDGWSDSVQDDMTYYDEIFEELHNKYKGKGSMPPELKLMMALGGSAIMFHMSKTMFSSLPGAESVMRRNPELARQFAAASMQQAAAAHQSSRGGGGGGLMGLVGSLFGGGDVLNAVFGGGAGSGGPPQHQPPFVPEPLQPQATRPVMRGPNMDDILGDINLQTVLNNKQQHPSAAAAVSDRVEMMSTVSESELSELQDGASTVRGVFIKPPASSRGRGRASGGVAVHKKQSLNI